WHNLRDREGFSGMGAFFRSFTSFDWRIHTPMLSVVAWILATGWLLSLLPRSAGRRRVILAALACGGWLGALLIVIPSAEFGIFDGFYEAMWTKLHALAGPHAVGLLAGTAALAVAAHMAVTGSERIFGSERASLILVLEYLICGGLA